jgi:outer membrane protein insertion porin family
MSSYQKNFVFQPLFLPLLFVLLFVSNYAHAQFSGKLLGSSKLRTTYEAPPDDIDYANPKEYVIGGVTVEGVQFLDKNSLIAISGLEVGKKISVPGDDINNAIKKLWKQGILGDVKINLKEISGNEVFIELELKERPRLSKFVFEGIKKSDIEELNGKVKLVKGRILTDAMLKNAKKSIEKFYIEKGFYNVNVRMVQLADTLGSNTTSLRIIVDKNKRVKIRNIIFEKVDAPVEGANVQITEKNPYGLQIHPQLLRKKMKKTKENRRFLTGSKFLPKQYEEDKEKIIAFYNTKGFRNAKIVSDSVYKVAPNELEIRIRLEEDKKFYYRNITWTGNHIYTSEGLSQILGIRRGDTYNPEELNKKLNFNPAGSDITSLYMDDGYLFFRIEPVEVLVEGDSIDIEMRIYEGEQATIRKVIVNGNTKTNDHVIYREIRTLPGEKFSRSDLIRTQRELAQLGYFDPEKISINPKPNFADGTVDIEYGVEEKASDQIELSGGWGGYFGFVGTLGLVFNNFSARNIANFKKWKPLPSGDGQKLSLRLQANGVRFQTYSLSFVEPWLGGRQPTSLSISLSHSVQRVGGTFLGFGVGGSTQEPGVMRLYNASIGLGKRLQFPDDYFTLRHNLNLMVYNLDNFSLFSSAFRNGTSNNINYGVTLGRNSINNPTFPRTGSNISLALTFTPPYSLFENKSESEYRTQTDAERFEWLEYYKLMFDNSWFMPVVGKLTFNARMHLGFINAYNTAKGVGPFERFILGGSGLIQTSFLLGTDIIGLRGYTDNSIRPFDQAGQTNSGGVAFQKYVLELRYPVSLNPSATIFALAFAEGGNNFAYLSRYNPFQLKRSIGMGARIFMPAFGMLGIDYGYGFDEIVGSPGSNGGQFHFIIGQPLR